MKRSLEQTFEHFKMKAYDNPIGNKAVTELARRVSQLGEECMVDWKKKEFWDLGTFLPTGYFLCLIGEVEKGEKIFQRGLEYEQKKERREREEGDRDYATEIRLENIGYIIETLEETSGSRDKIEAYKEESASLKRKLEGDPKTLRKRIIHIEADIECMTQHLDDSGCRHAQGELCQKLGLHEKAIDYFKRAIGRGPRRLKFEELVRNKLDIIDSYLALRDKDSASGEFIDLLVQALPEDVNEGEKIPGSFLGNFRAFLPYYDNLGMADNLASVRKYFYSRFEALKKEIKKHTPNEKPEEHWKRTEMSDVTEILADLHCRENEFRTACDLYDEGRKFLEYKHHLSFLNQAEFAIMSGDYERASKLIDEDMKGDRSVDHDRLDNLVNLFLQMGYHNNALKVIDDEVAHYKTHCWSQSNNSLCEYRKMQVEILGPLVGRDYVSKLREYVKGKGGVISEGGVKLLAKHSQSQEK